MGLLNKGYKTLGKLNTIDKIASGKGAKHLMRKKARRYFSPEKLISGSRGYRFKLF